jgi:hypothetical protein
MADRLFYAFYRFFEQIHGPGDSAEVAALFTWSSLLALNIATLLVLVIAVAGTPPPLEGRIPFAFAVVGVIVAISQYFRYLAGDKLRSLRRKLDAEPAHARHRGFWASFGYVVVTLGAFCASLWLLSAMR